MLKLLAATFLICLALAIVCGVGVIIVGGFGSIMSSVSGANLDAQSPAIKRLKVAALVVPLFWTAVRLAPLAAVYVDPAVSPVGIVAGIRRAFVLTRGHSITILLVYVLWSFAAAPLFLAPLWLVRHFGLIIFTEIPRLLVQLVMLPLSLAITLYFSVALGVLYRQLTANEAPAVR